MSVRASSTADLNELGVHDLPPYQRPEFPMNDAAIRALNHLQQAQSQRNLDQHFRQAAQYLTDSAAAINDRLTERKERDQKLRQKHTNALTDVDHQRAAHLQTFDKRVTDMTKRMEDTMRKIIDAQYAAHITQEELQHTSRQAATNARAVQQERLTQTQQRDEDDDEQTDYDPTLPGATQRSTAVPLVVPHDLFQTRLQAQVAHYDALAPGARYAEHADYTGFKEAVHHASYVEGAAPPLAHRSTWFAGGRGGGAEDDDDEVAIAGENISTKCPITLVDFVEPVTSGKCPHSFERSAILEMIACSNTFAGGSNRRGAVDGVRTVACPVCDAMIVEKDLRPDTKLIRKMQRIQRQRAEDDEDDEDEDMVDGDSRAQVIGSSAADGDGFEDVDDGPAASGGMVVPKMERLSGASRFGGGGGGGMGGFDATQASRFGGGFDATQASTVVDLGSEEESEDEDE